MICFSIILIIILSTSNIINFPYFFFFFQAEDGIRDAQESRGLGDVYKRQYSNPSALAPPRPCSSVGSCSLAPQMHLWNSGSCNNKNPTMTSTAPMTVKELGL
eukprot:TRINITY_DN57150_c0_g1_i1.p2 TRINITY_DN57150_c0_g1~~TRINITY_DN57150_c0_g1_i1.p2  ORF type:complete len:103 (+),score=24.47 TRINITY_DN57150_c0_g1_i1:66-374(+)